MRGAHNVPTGLLVRCSLVLSIAFAPAFGQELALPATMGAVTVIDRMKDDLNDVINHAQVAVSASSFDVRQNAEVLLQQLALMANDLERKTIGDLNKSQREFFARAQQTISEVRAQEKLAASDARKLIESANDAVGSTLIGSDTARVLDFSPRYVSPDRPSSVAFQIRGSWLGAGVPIVKADGQLCEVLSYLETEVNVRCGVTPPKGNEVVYEKLSIDVTDRQGAMDRFFGWFHDNKVHRNYQVGVAVVPRTLGSFRGVATVHYEEPEIVERSEHRYATNGHCDGERTYSWTINATKGYEIVEQPVTQKIRDSTAVDRGVQAWTPSSFRIEASARNSGRCVFGGGDGRGDVEIVASWRERRMVTREKELVLAIGDITWGNELQQALPEGTVAVSIEGKLIDGTSVVDTNEDHPARRWFQSAFDISARKLIIRPKSLIEALAD